MNVVVNAGTTKSAVAIIREELAKMSCTPSAQLERTLTQLEAGAAMVGGRRRQTRGRRRQTRRR